MQVWKKYDPDGIPYKGYVFNVDNQPYTTQIKEQIYLQEGMTVLLGIIPNSSNEVIAGYCLKEGYTWGENSGKLKKKLNHLKNIIFWKVPFWRNKNQPPDQFIWTEVH